MAKFKDFLAALNRDIILARANADAQSADMAQAYGEHPLLSSLDISVPRMKIKDIDIELEAFIRYNIDTNPNQEQYLPVSNIEVIEFSHNHIKDKLDTQIADTNVKAEIYQVLQKVDEMTINYAERYVKDPVSIPDRVKRISNYYIDKFESAIVAVTEGYRDILELTYKTLREDVQSLIKMNNEEEGCIEMEFSPENLSTDFGKVKINFTLEEDDLIWEIDKQITD